MKTLIILTSLLSFSTIADGNCLNEISDFAIRICGEIENSGKRELVETSGELDFEISGIVRRIVGSFGASGSRRKLVETYEGVLANEIALDKFDVRNCRIKMVEVARKEVCDPDRSSDENIADQTFSAQWLAEKGGRVGRDPVFSRTIIGYGEFLVCRATTDYGILPGHLVRGQDACYVALGSSSGKFHQYEVLQESGRYEWKNHEDIEKNSELVYVGTQRNTGDKNYVCARGDGWVGRLEGRVGGCCWIAWSNTNKCLANYDVLVPASHP